MDDKIIEYFKLVELHNQNILSQYIYRNTYRLNMKQRSEYFRKIIQIPALILAIYSVIILFINLFLGIIFSIIFGIVFVVGVAYNYDKNVKKSNKEDENIMYLTNNLVRINQFMEQVTFINKCEIEEQIKELYDPMNKSIDPIENLTDKIDHYIVGNLDANWNTLGFSEISASEIERILYLFNHNFDIFIKQIQKFKIFYENYVHEFKEKKAYNILNNMIEILNKRKNQKQEYE